MFFSRRSVSHATSVSTPGYSLSGEHGRPPDSTLLFLNDLLPDALPCFLSPCTQINPDVSFPGGFLPVGRREWRIHFRKNVLLSFVVCWWVVVVVRLVRFYYLGCVVCFVVGVCLLSGLREPVTHSLGGRALLLLGLLMFVEISTDCSGPAASHGSPLGGPPWWGVFFRGELGMKLGMACFQHTHLAVDVPDPGGISWSG